MGDRMKDDVIGAQFFKQRDIDSFTFYVPGFSTQRCTAELKGDIYVINFIPKKSSSFPLKYTKDAVRDALNVGRWVIV